MDFIPFVILCSRKSLSSGQKESIRNLLKDEMPWPEILRVARKERVAELLYFNLKPYAQDIPVWIMKTLKRQYLFNLKRNLVLFHLLNPLLKTVSDFKIKAVLVKGGRLAESVYQNPGLRTFWDLDFFVASSHHKKMLSALKKSGCEFPNKTGFNPDAVGENDMNSTFRPVFRKGILEIEIHHSLPGLHLPLMHEEELWNDTGELNIEGAPARVLSLEYELCALCLHAQQHSYSLLMWMVDIAEIASLSHLNWNRVLEICRKEKISESVFYTLNLVNALWKGTVPEPALNRFLVSRPVIKMMQKMWPEERISGRRIREFPMHAPTFFSVLSKKNPLLIVRTVVKFVFPSKQWLSYYYGISGFSWKLVRHYAWRLTHPVILTARHLLRLD